MYNSRGSYHLLLKKLLLLNIYNNKKYKYNKIIYSFKRFKAYLISNII